MTRSRTKCRLPSARRRAVEQQRAGDHPAEDVDQHDVGDEDPDQQQHRLDVRPLIEVDVLAGLAPRPTSPRRTAIGESRRPGRSGHAPRTSGTARGPSGSTPVRLSPSVAASISTMTPSTARKAHTPSWRGRVRPAAAGASPSPRPPRSCQAQLLSVSSTRGGLLGQERGELAQPVRNASVQPFLASTSFHSGLACIVVSGRRPARLVGRRRSPGARRRRASW